MVFCDWGQWGWGTNLKPFTVGGEEVGALQGPLTSQQEGCDHVLQIVAFKR